MSHLDGEIGNGLAPRAQRGAGPGVACERERLEWALGSWVDGARAWARRGLGGRAPATQVRMSSCVQSFWTQAWLNACAKSQPRLAACMCCQVPAFWLVYPTQPLFPASEMYLMVPTPAQDTMSGCAARRGRPRYRAEVARDGGGLAGGLKGSRRLCKGSKGRLEPWYHRRRRRPSSCSAAVGVEGASVGENGAGVYGVVDADKRTVLAPPGAPAGKS